MSEPTSIGHMALWGGGTIGSGLALAVGAVEANPEVALALTPDIGTSIVGLVCAGVVLALKTYVPSEKDVKQEFLALKSQHGAIIEMVKEVKSDGKAVQDELHEHRLMLAGWMGDVNRNLANINGKIDSLERRKAS